MIRDNPGVYDSLFLSFGQILLFRFTRSPEDPDYFLNKTNKEGQTALYIAAKNGNLNVIELLLRFKAEPSILSLPSKSSSRKFSPVYVASMYSILEISLSLLTRSCLLVSKISHKCSGFLDSVLLPLSVAFPFLPLPVAFVCCLCLLDLLCCPFPFALLFL